MCSSPASRGRPTRQHVSLRLQHHRRQPGTHRSVGHRLARGCRFGAAGRGRWPDAASPQGRSALIRAQRTESPQRPAGSTRPAGRRVSATATGRHPATSLFWRVSWLGIGRHRLAVMNAGAGSGLAEPRGVCRGSPVPFLAATPCVRCHRPGPARRLRLTTGDRQCAEHEFDQRAQRGDYQRAKREFDWRAKREFD